MAQSPSSPRPFPLGSLVIIAAVAGVAAVAFAYTAGWLSPERLTPKKIVAALAPPGGPGAGPSSQPRQRHLFHRYVRG